MITAMPISSAQEISATAHRKIRLIRLLSNTAALAVVLRSRAFCGEPLRRNRQLVDQASTKIADQDPVRTCNAARQIIAGGFNGPRRTHDTHFHSRKTKPRLNLPGLHHD